MMKLSFVPHLVWISMTVLTFIRHADGLDLCTSGMPTSRDETPHTFLQQPEYPRDCSEIHARCQSSNTSGVYVIKPDGYPDPFDVYCDNSDDSAGWTVLLRRVADGLIEFDRYWEDYKQGFGFLSSEFWIGNERLSYLTNQKDYQAEIEMTFTDGSKIAVSLDNFRIGDEFSNYSLGNVPADPPLICPMNMIHGDCTCIQRSCRDPSLCQTTCADDQYVGCICPEGYFMEGVNCVPKAQCGCYIPQEGRILLEGETFIDGGCTFVSTCSNGQLDINIQHCSSNAACDVRQGTRMCYCHPGYSGNGVTCTINNDCMDVYNGGSMNSGVYLIKPTNWPGPHFPVYCNMTDGGGWTVFQRRVDGGVTFSRDWDDYKRGFGEQQREHWLGNDKIYFLSNQRRYHIRIDLVNSNGDPYYAKYSYFRINNEADNYRLSELGTYSGTAGDSLADHQNGVFSTMDRDNDDSSSFHCAEYLHSAWWYLKHEDYQCNRCDLNRVYEGYTGENDKLYAIRWQYLPGSSEHVKFIEMKLRPELAPVD